LIFPHNYTIDFITAILNSRINRVMPSYLVAYL
jgi:hypothetical protein